MTMATHVTMVFGPSGGNLMYNDAALTLMQPIVQKVSRLTQIEYAPATGEWTVYLEVDGRPKFRNKRRDVCLLWEKMHAAELLEETMRLQVPIEGAPAEKGER